MNSDTISAHGMLLMPNVSRASEPQNPKPRNSSWISFLVALLEDHGNTGACT